KLPLKTNIKVKKGEPVTMTVYVQNARQSLYKNINVNIVSSLVPEIAQKNAITKERIISQISKTTNTPFEFKEINIDLEDGLFIPSIKELNEIRRMSLTKLESIILSRIKRNTDLDEEKLDQIYTKYTNSFLSKYSVQAEKNDENTKQVVAYFN